MAFTQADLDNVNRAIASGVTEVRFADGRLVTYRGVKDLMIAKSDIEAELFSSSQSTIVRQIRPIVTRGW